MVDLAVGLEPGDVGDHPLVADVDVAHGSGQNGRLLLLLILSILVDLFLELLLLNVGHRLVEVPHDRLTGVAASDDNVGHRGVVLEREALLGGLKGELWFNPLCELPNNYIRNVHLAADFHPLIERHSLAHAHSHDALLGRVPVDAGKRLALGEVEVGEVSELLQLVLHLAANGAVVVSHHGHGVSEDIHRLVLLQCRLDAAEGLPQHARKRVHIHLRHLVGAASGARARARARGSSYGRVLRGHIDGPIPLRLCGAFSDFRRRLDADVALHSIHVKFREAGLLPLHYSGLVVVAVPELKFLTAAAQISAYGEGEQGPLVIDVQFLDLLDCALHGL
mmetsp:Transcript_24909/g.46834  ORF Transcript_24909/g.46834 Transcript_24909/m.46834 type:complete len:336 (+) Transcript_24909:1216-2223(+)